MSKRLPMRPKDLSAEVGAIFDSMNDSPDLSLAIVGAAFIDSALGSLLRSKFVDSTVSEKLLDPNSGALGALHPRARLAYVLGLVEKPFLQDCCTIGEIRNIFAHRHLLTDFQDPSVAKLCNKLQAPEMLIKLSGPNGAMKTLIECNPRNRYLIAGTLIGNQVLMKAHQVERQHPQ